MGSRFKIDLAYIAGFLDGDGSLMLQIKKRKDSKRGVRFMATICFYQNSRHELPLRWFRKILGIGYLAKRNDGMSELRINGFKEIQKILEDLMPFIKFKKQQAKSLYRAVSILSNKSIKNLDKIEIKSLIDCIINIQKENYAAKKKKTREELYSILGLTP